MTLSEKECAAIRELIPMYVKGLLTASQHEELEKALTVCPEFETEVIEWLEIKKAYGFIEKELPLPSSRIYSKIAETIDKEKGLGFSRFLHGKFKIAPGFSLALIAAQFLIIITLAMHMAGLKPEYRTLSAPAIKTDMPVKINIVFAENVSEAEIRKLLLQVNARIIDGPYSSGLYIIGLPSEDKAKAALKTLKKDSIVTMVERAY